MTEEPRRDWRSLTTPVRQDLIEAELAKNADASAGDIAFEIGRTFDNVTRNAIIGIIHRSKGKIVLRKGKTSKAAKVHRERNQVQKERRLDRDRANVARNKIARATASPHPDDAAPADASFILSGPPEPWTAVCFIQSNEHTCKWPLWDRFEGAEVSAVCGGHSEEGSPYCAFHRRAATKPPRMAA